MVAVAVGGCVDTPAPSPDPCASGAYADETSEQCFCEPGSWGDPELECVPHDDHCAEAEARLGHSVCAHTIDDEAQWTQLSLGGGPTVQGTRRLGKYMVPVSAQSRLPTLFSDANAYRLHYCLMSVGFAPLFPGLTTADHAELIMTHAGREFYAGAIYEFTNPNPLRYGFSIETAVRAEEMLPPETIYQVYRQLADRFEPGELGYLPRGLMQTETAAGFVDPPFEIITVADEGVAIEAYTTGIAYGRIRIGTVDDWTGFSWQDIVVMEEVPLDLEGVLGGAITGQRQDILSHLNVLSAQRGTPNFFVDDAVEVFSQFEGQLVRIEAAADNYTLRAATQAEAEAFWQQQRPATAVENPAEFDYDALDAFSAIPTETAEQRAQARARFGAKTIGLATLAPLIDPRYQTPGLGVPFHYYDAFMRENTWSADLGQGAVTASYAETIDAWLDDDEFRTNASLRKQRLEQLRDEMRDNGVVSPQLVQALRERIADEFGSEQVMVRVRSSSNAEDTPTFNGAGLYDSTSGCAADSGLPSAPEVSACDPNKPGRSLERALAKVWASQWNYGAFEERDYHQLDHRAIAMGATISLRFEDEVANGVAFTGNPIDRRDARFTINAQAGEVDVVSPTPGVNAELSRLTLEGGRVTQIDRLVPSTLVVPGEVVVSDAHLEQLGAIMAGLEDTYPVDYTAAESGAPLLDLEFKITRQDALVIKQIRTFSPSPYSADRACLD